jgi:hypothetical protein
MEYRVRMLLLYSKRAAYLSYSWWIEEMSPVMWLCHVGVSLFVY